MAYGSAPLSSASFFTPSLFAFGSASKALSESTLKLASGSRINRAGDDVAAFSIATRMQTQLASLKQGTANAVQGDSLLQVAQGGLQQILELLDSMSTLASQSNSGSISNSDRAYLQAEFSAYTDEIDRISTSTSFNGISLLDGNLSGASTVYSQTANATQASATLSFNANPTAAQTVVLNGATLVAGTDFTVGGDTATTLESLKTALNNSTDTRLSNATYTRSGTQLIITGDAGGTLGSLYTVNKASSTTDYTVSNGATTQVANLYTLTGGDDDGLSLGSVTASGTIGDTLITTQSQTKGSVTLTLTGNANNAELLRIDDGNGSTVSFTFATTASLSTDIQIGANKEETLQNIISTVTNYSGTSNYVTKQLEFEINGDSLIIRNKLAGDSKDFSGAVPDISETLTNGSLSAATITGGTNTGVNTTGVTNKDFIGQVTGFTATYNSADNITASITVGDSTYTATISDTTPTAGNSTVRFTSTDGGYFDVQLAQNQGLAVTNQTDATSYASRLNAAFEDLTFYQSREMTNFSDTGDFVGASASFQLDDFSDVRIDSIAVTAPASGGDAQIDITIDGEIFRANTGIGETLGANETLTFTSTTDSNRKIRLTNGSTGQDFAATDFEDNLRTAFAVGVGGSGVNFQVGPELTDRVSVEIGSASADTLFNGNTPDISTQDNAASAQTSIDNARTKVLTALSEVGALQARFQSAQDLNSRVIEGVTAARSSLADTDIAEESTNYATSALKVNSGVAVIAQARQLQASLLTILNAGLD